MYLRLVSALCILLCCSRPLSSTEQDPFIDIPAAAPSEGFVINFSKVSMLELVKFVSKIAEVNFIFDDNTLDFEVSFITGRPCTRQNVVKAVKHILKQHKLNMYEEDEYYIIEEAEKVEEEVIPPPPESLPTLEPIEIEPLPPEEPVCGDFQVYKLRYHQGDEILNAIKQISGDILASGAGGPDLLTTIQSMQWIRTTNTLLFSGSPLTNDKLTELIKKLDVPSKQVFIEVLVLETAMKNALDFGVQWSSNSLYKKKIGAHVGDFNPSPLKPSLANAGSKMERSTVESLGSKKGFDLGIIGDLIFHKGRSFISLGSLVSALQQESDVGIILNQKVVTQDNKNSKIFVGENVPFAGSVVSTVGQSQQTTANIEYRDIGVSLNITPLLGDDGMVNLEISEEITEASGQTTSQASLSGIQTTKANMVTQAHVPDQHFLILSGMTRNKRTKVKTGPPCLGGLSMLSSAFSQHEQDFEKRSILIFVRPHIITSSEDYTQLTSELTEYEDIDGLPELE